jgi:hypothetical protein
MKRPGKIPIHPADGHDMGGAGKKEKPRGKVGDKSGKTPAPSREDDDVEDGDIATPKRDRNDEDDQPL